MRYVSAVMSALIIGLFGATARAQEGQELPTVKVTTTQPKATKKKASTPNPAVQALVPSGSSEDQAGPLTFAPPDELDPRAADVGIAQSASQGVVVEAELAMRPVYRTGELLESVPGLIVTQHSGGGKANQYFLRGYN